MNKRLALLAGFAFAAAVPLAAQAHGGVSVAISTPEFGFRIGAPWVGPIYAPAQVVVPAPVYPATIYAPPPPVVYAPAPVVIAAPRIVYPVPAFVPPPRVVYRRSYLPPRVIVPYGHGHPGHGSFAQEAGYRMPPGQTPRYAYNGRYQ